MSDEHRAATSGANVEARDVFGSVFAANILRLTSEQQALFTDLFRQMLSEQRPGGIVNVAMGVGATATTVSEVPYIPPDASAMMEVIRQSFQTFYAKPWGLPDKNEAFAGRQTELAQLKAGLLREGTACISTREEGTKTFTSETTQDRTAAAQEGTAAGESKRKAILGPGGFGKTQLAIACAYELANEYHFVIYFHGSRELLSRDIRSLARETGFGFRDDTPVESIAKSLYWLLDHLPRVLFIVDDVERLSEVKGLLPPKDNPHFHCLYTSRRQDIWKRHFKSGFERILLGVFAPEESIDYFDKAASPELKSQNAEAENYAQWRILSEKLGHLPLALSQAMAYLNEHCKKADAIARYIKDFERNFSRFASCSPDDIYQHTILTTWMMTLPKLLKRSWFAVELFFSLAYLRGEDISVLLVESYCAERVGLPEAMREGDYVESQIDHLKRYSLITVLDGNRIQIHNMVQQAIIWWLSEDNDIQRSIAAASYTGESGSESDKEGEDESRTHTTVLPIPQATYSYPKQIDAIARHIERAKKEGCVTAPYQLICTMGDAFLGLGGRAQSAKSPLTSLMLDTTSLEHIHSLLLRLVELAEFKDVARAAIMPSDISHLSRSQKLVSLFFLLLTRRMMLAGVDFIFTYREIIDSLLAQHVEGYGRLVLFFTKPWLQKIPPEILLSAKQWKAIANWVERSLAQDNVDEKRRNGWRAVLKILRALSQEYGVKYQRQFVYALINLTKETFGLDNKHDLFGEKLTIDFHIDNPFLAFFVQLNERVVNQDRFINDSSENNFEYTDPDDERSAHFQLLYELSDEANIMARSVPVRYHDAQARMIYALFKSMGLSDGGYRLFIIMAASALFNDFLSLSEVGEQQFRLLSLVSTLIKWKLNTKDFFHLAKQERRHMILLVLKFMPPGSVFSGIYDTIKNVRRLLNHENLNEAIHDLYGKEFYLYCSADSMVQDREANLNAADFAFAGGFHSVASHYYKRVLSITDIPENIPSEMISVHAKFAFSLLVLDEIEEAGLLFGKFLKEGTLRGCPAVFYGYYLLSVGEWEAALPYIRQAYTQEGILTVFCMWKSSNTVPNFFSSNSPYRFLSPFNVLDGRQFSALLVMNYHSMIEELPSADIESAKKILFSMSQLAQGMIDKFYILAGQHNITEKTANLTPQLDIKTVVKEDKCEWQESQGLIHTDNYRHSWLIGELEKAEEMYCQAILEEPTRDKYVDYAHFLYQKGQWQIALEYFDASFQCGPAPALCYKLSEQSIFETGIQIIMQGLVAEQQNGAEVFTFPLAALTYYLMARCHERLGDENSRQATLFQLSESIFALREVGSTEIATAELLYALAQCDYKDLVVGAMTDVSLNIEDVKTARSIRENTTLAEAGIRTGLQNMTIDFKPADSSSDSAELIDSLEVIKTLKQLAPPATPVDIMQSASATPNEGLFNGGASSTSAQAMPGALSADSCTGNLPS